MNTINIELENCFGIGKFEYTFDFGGEETNAFIIYAPNGSMKSSFAKTLDLISKNDSENLPCDRVYKERITKYKIEVNGIQISPESILVVNAEDSNYDTSSKISTFIASKELKNKYDEIYADLENKKGEYLKKLKQESQSTDCEKEFVETFKQNSNDTFFDLLLSNSKKMISNPVKYEFRYNDIFDKKGNVKRFIDKNYSLLTQYINNYNDLLNKSKFFKRSENSFGTYQANALLNSISDNSYFEAGHKLTLEDNTVIFKASELQELLNNEITNIVNDKKLKNSFKQVDKAIGANNELRSFKTAIDKNNFLLIKLQEYENFRKELWLNYISRLNDATKELSVFYESKKYEIDKIIKEAKKEFEIWEQIIKTFNERFYVPFEIKLVNQEDVILKEVTANLEFDYKEPNESPVRKDKNTLLAILSKGEQRAFYILQLLFDIESRKHLNHNTLLILDDIADSFDYKNKYAIIEYIKDFNESNIFRSIILTHNFDFYRSVAKRLGLVNNRNITLMALKDQSRVISLTQGQYLNNIFDHFKNRIFEKKFFISIIPLVRNLTEYIECKEKEDIYNILTSCLHIKKNTNTITCGKVLDVIHICFPTTSAQQINFSKEFIKNQIYFTADEIVCENQINEISLENKITLSIAIRLKAEEFMITALGDKVDITKITRNQTRVLFDHYKTNNPSYIETIKILDRVNLMTPENIHINAFMYEPLIDISVLHLVALYRDLTQLLSNEIITNEKSN